MAREIYGLGAEARPLPSERDQNFALQTAAGEKFVLKIAKSDEARGVLELQNAALKHVALHAPSLALQRLIATSPGEDIATIMGAQGQSYFLRLMTWLEGEMFVHARPHDAVLLESLGCAMAEMDLAFQDFSHPAMDRELHWDVKRADLALQYLPLLPDPLAAAFLVIRAYHARYPLTGAEAGALFSLTAARLCMSICYAAHNAQAKSGDAYQLVTAGPAWELLQRLDAEPLHFLQNSFRNACAGEDI